MPTAVSETDWSAAKRARVAAARRQRRVIFNTDAEEMTHKGANTVEGFLAPRLRPLVGTHVGTISYSVINGDAPTYASKVQLIFSDAHGAPLTLRKGVVQRTPLVVGDDVEAASTNSLLARLKLMLKLKGPVAREALLLRLNGDTLSDGEFLTLDAEDQESQINYPISAPPLRAGQNFIEVSLASVPTSPVELYSIRLKVEYESDA